MEDIVTIPMRIAIEKLIGQHQNSYGDQEIVDQFEENGTVENSMTTMTHVIEKLLRMEENGEIDLPDVTIKYRKLDSTDFEFNYVD